VRVLETTVPGEDPATKRLQIERIARSARRMRRLVSDPLDIAAIESGSLRVVPARCCVESIVGDALGDATPEAADASVKIVDDVAGSRLPPVWADPERLHQVLRNLVGNAVKFTPRGGTVGVRAAVAGDAVLIEVIDTGIGIAPAELLRVFDRFWQGDPGRGIGTGLGLAICKSLVEQGGGAVSAASTEGKGTTIAFTVPLAR
jgi:signal transduction histidine kinase